MAAAGSRGAVRLLAMRKKIDHPITAILTFNTLANTVGASIMGSMVASYYGGDSPAVWIYPIIFTVIILLFSEITPKTLGVILADRIAPRSALAIQFLIIGLKPFIILSESITSRIRRLGGAAARVSEADIIAQARAGAEQGSLLPEEARWVNNVLHLNEKTAHDLMTPRTVVYLLPAELKLSQVSAHSKHWAHSRLPLCRDNDPDRIVGIVYRRDVFDALATRSREQLEATCLGDLMTPVDFIPETLPANQILQRFLASRHHMFIVTNEHGGLEGVITLEDVIEEILGQEIVDAHDEHTDMQEYARALARMRRGAQGDPATLESTRGRLSGDGI
jgi:CBS domain containing-hemolysin-like protein